MPRFVDRLRRRRRQVAAGLLTAATIAAIVVAVMTAHTWASCHNPNVASYPKAYPQCGPSSQTHRPEIMTGAGGIALILAVGAAYLWTDPGPEPLAPAAPRPRPADREQPEPAEMAAPKPARPPTKRKARRR